MFCCHLGSYAFLCRSEKKPPLIQIGRRDGIRLASVKTLCAALIGIFTGHSPWTLYFRPRCNASAILQVQSNPTSMSLPVASVCSTGCTGAEEASCCLDQLISTVLLHESVLLSFSAVSVLVQEREESNVDSNGKAGRTEFDWLLHRRFALHSLGVFTDHSP